MQLFNERLNYFNTNKVSKCKLLALTEVKSSKLWFNGFSDGSIRSWTDYMNEFLHTSLPKKDNRWLRPLWDELSKEREKTCGLTSTNLCKLLLKSRDLKKALSVVSFKITFKKTIPSSWRYGGGMWKSLKRCWVWLSLAWYWKRN